MKITGLGEAKVIDVGELVLPRRAGPPIKLVLRALPLGFNDRSEEMFPRPTPPMTGYAREKSGTKGKSVLVRDPMTGRPLPMYDEADPAFQAKRRERNQLSTTAMLHYAMGADANIAWTSKRDTFASDVDFYKAVYKEIVDFGFSIGDFTMMVEFILDISNLRADDLKEAKEDFLSEMS